MGGGRVSEIVLLGGIINGGDMSKQADEERAGWVANGVGTRQDSP